MPLQGLLGILTIVLLAWAASEDRRAIPWRLVAVGLIVQLAVAFLLYAFVRNRIKK